VTIQSVTIPIPNGLYDRLKRRAEQAHHSIEAEVLEMVAAAIPADEELPSDLADAVARLATANDDALWQLVHARFSAEKSAQLENLHLKRQDRGLNQSEAKQAADLAEELEKFMFMRAQAMALLMQRGHDLSSLIRV